MADYYRNPTASAAIGSVDKEIARIRKRAKQLRSLRSQGRLTPAMLAAERQHCSGIFRRVLENELRKPFIPEGEEN